jgi:hypothetical protein
MKYFGDGLSEMHKELNRIILKADQIEESKRIFLNIHSKLHLSKISDNTRNEVDELINDLKESEYSIMPTSKDETIAWAIWHIARIEDLTMNLLVNEGEQVFNEEWKHKLNAPITDTGNALSDDEIMSLSKSLNISELLNYRNAVGLRTRSIVHQLHPEDMKRKITNEIINKILLEGGVTEDKDSIWLLDFWGTKDVAGILLMPPTRHVFLYLNDCCKWKEAIRSKKEFYLYDLGGNDGI